MTPFEWLEIYGVWISPLIILGLCYLRALQYFLFSLVAIMDGIFLLDLALHSPTFNLHGSDWFNPNVAGLFIVLSTLFLREIKQAKSNRNLTLISSLLILFSIILAGSTEVFLVGTMILLLELYSKLGKRIFLAILPILLSLPFLYSDISRQFQIRLEILKTSLRIVAENPQGIGFSNFHTEFEKYRTPGYIALKGLRNVEVDPHNLILAIVMTFGFIVGFLIIGLLVLISLVAIQRDKFSIFVLGILAFHSVTGVNSFFINSIGSFLIGRLAFTRFTSSEHLNK